MRRKARGAPGRPLLPVPCGGEQRRRPAGRVGLNEWRGSARVSGPVGPLARPVGPAHSPELCRPQAGVGGRRHQADQRWQRAAAGNGERLLAPTAGWGGTVGGIREAGAASGACGSGNRVPAAPPAPAVLWDVALCLEGHVPLGRKVNKCSLVDVKM